MKFDFAVCSSSEVFIHQINKAIHSIFSTLSDIFTITLYNTSDELYSELPNRLLHHIYFIEITPGVIDGIALAEKIRSINGNDVIIIFLSNYSEYMQKSFDVKAFNYITAPINPFSFKNVIEKAINETREKSPSRILISDSHNEYVIDVFDIIMIETLSKERALLFHLCDSQLIIKSSLTHAIQLLSDYNFFLCHKGIIINLDHIRSISDDHILLSNNIEAPLSRRAIKDLRNNFLLQNKAGKPASSP